MSESFKAVAAKSVPGTWKKVIDAESINRAIARVSYEIIERNPDVKRLAVVGIRTCGEFIGKRLRDKIAELEGVDIPFGVIDITLYRDDLSQAASQPMLKGTELPFSVSGSRIIVVDDVFYTGRTVRSALDAIIDFGRPSCIELAALVDRGHRELPIRPDFVGKNLPTSRNENVKVRLSEQGYEDAVYIVQSESKGTDHR